MATAKPPLVFFGIERSDRDDDCDISQIVMKCHKSAFNKYVNPTRSISSDMTKINHLTVRNLQIFRDKKMKRSLPLNIVLEELYQYLKELDGPCTLVAHKFFHNVSLLMRAIKELGMEKKFASVIAGFTDTFPMFMNKFPNMDPKKLNIHALAKSINLRAQQPLSYGRSIKDNVKILAKLALHYFDAEELRAKRSFSSELRKIERSVVPARMSQAAMCSANANYFTVEDFVADPQRSKKDKKRDEKALQKKRREKNNENENPRTIKTKAKNIENLEAITEFTLSNACSSATADCSTAEAVTRDDESNVIDCRSAKNRPNKNGKERKRKGFREI